MTTITIDRAVVEQALEALIRGCNINATEWHQAIYALRAALAQQAEPVKPAARECSDPMCACRGGPCAECEEGEREKEIEDLRSSLYFYQRRCEALQSWQSKMRDPERTIVCDILANGKTLDPAVAGDRYTAPPQKAEPMQEPVAWLQPKTVDGHLRPDLGYETCSKTDYGAFSVYAAPPLRPTEPAQGPEGMVEFLADLQRSRTKYPKNRRMFDGLMGEIDELRRAYAGDGDIRAEAFDVAVCAFRIATEGDAGGNARLEQAEPAQEPVAWIESPHGAIRANPNYKFTFPSQLLHWQIPLYTAPPQRKPLSKQDQHCVDVPGYGLTAVRLVRAIERAHGIT